MRWLVSFVALFFLFVVGLIAFAIIKALATAISNARQPVIDREARIIARRQEISTRGGMNNAAVSTTTAHFLTFEFKDGFREEFLVGGRDFGLLVEGDAGTLRSQGTWFKGFSRH